MARPKKTKSNKETETDPDALPQTVQDAVEVIEAEVQDEAAADQPAGPDAQIVEDVSPEPEAVVAPPARKRGFIAPFLGGVAAAALGFGAALYLFPEGYVQKPDVEQWHAQTQARLAKQDDALAKLGAEQARATDTTALSDSISSLAKEQEALKATLDAQAGTSAAIEERLAKLELAPVSGGASEAAVAAYERELKAAQEALAAQRADIEAANAEADVKKAQAETSARTAMTHAALSRIGVSLENGTQFSAALEDLASVGQDVPDVLERVAKTGVAPMATLQDSFPEAARAALQAVRTAAVSKGDESGFVAFLKTHLGMRSLEPQEGNDPDAILSRAEAALHDGRLTDALAELQALPEEARSALADWTGIATTRQEALEALNTLSQSINTN